MRKILLTVVSVLLLAITLTADSPSKMYTVNGDVALHIINPNGQTLDVVVMGPVRPWQDKAYLQIPADGQLSIPSVTGLGIPVSANGLVTISSCNQFYLAAFKLVDGTYVPVSVNPFGNATNLNCGNPEDSAGQTIISDPPPDGGGNGEDSGGGGDEGDGGHGHGGDGSGGHGGGHCDDGHGQDGERNPHCSEE